MFQHYMFILLMALCGHGQAMIRNYPPHEPSANAAPADGQQRPCVFTVTAAERQLLIGLSQTPNDVDSIHRWSLEWRCLQQLIHNSGSGSSGSGGLQEHDGQDTAGTHPWQTVMPEDDALAGPNPGFPHRSGFTPFTPEVEAFHRSRSRTPHGHRDGAGVGTLHGHSCSAGADTPDDVHRAFRHHMGSRASMNSVSPLSEYATPPWAAGSSTNIWTRFYGIRQWRPRHPADTPGNTPVRAPHWCLRQPDGGSGGSGGASMGS